MHAAFKNRIHTHKLTGTYTPLLLVVSIILILVFFTAQKAEADIRTAVATPGVDSSASTPSGIGVANSQPGIDTNATTRAPGTTGIGNATAAGSGGENTDGPTWLTKIGQWIGNSILAIAAFFTGLGGLILDTAVSKTVLEMGSNLSTNSPMGRAISDAWVIIRDIANLIFIFGFVYIGVLTIYDYESANTRRRLAQIIIAALLINFSLLITKVVIDVSNVLAVELYSASVTNASGQIGSYLMELLRLKEVYTTIDGKDLAVISSAGSFAYYIGAALFLFIAGFVFAAGGLLLIVRYVALILIMVFSPILFAATVFPQTSKHATELWSKLFSYAFFAPVYFLLLFISIKLIEGMQLGLSDQTFVEQLLSGKQSPAGFWSVILNYIIIIIFLIFSLLIAQKMSIRGGEAAVRVGKWSRGVFTGAAGRQFIGRPLNWADKKLEDRGVSSTSPLRQIASAGAGAKFGDTFSTKQITEAKEQARRKGAHKKQVDNLKSKLESGSSAAANTATRIDMERAVADASVKQLESLEVGEVEKIAGLLTTSQLDGLSKGDKFDETEVSRIRVAHQNAVKAIYETNKNSLSRASTDHLTALGMEYLSDEKNAIRLGSSQMDELKKKFTKTEFETLNDAREKALEELAKGGSIDGESADYILEKKSGEIAKMPLKVLAPLEDRIPVQALVKIVTDGTLKKSDQSQIRTTIENLIQNIPTGASQEQLDRLAALEDWLENSPLGKQFGK